MAAAQRSVGESPGDLNRTLTDDDLAILAQRAGYYDPDSAAYVADSSDDATDSLESAEEGLPGRELVTA